MNGHLVTVKVCVECMADERMQADCLSADEYRLKCLDTKSVQSRRPIQKYRMLLHDIVKHRPYFRCFLLNQGLRLLDIVDHVFLDEFLHDERFVQLQRHLGRKTALVEL